MFVDSIHSVDLSISTQTSNNEAAAASSDQQAVLATKRRRRQHVTAYIERQYLVTFAATLLLLSAGFALGWSSPAVPLLRASDSPVPVSSEASAWIVASMELGVLCVALPAVWMMDKFGRRLTLLSGIAPICLAWCLIATVANHPSPSSTGIATLCLARLLAGCTFGIGLAVCPIYISECTSARVRGRCAVMVTVSVQLGVLLAYAIGLAVTPASMHWLAWISLCPAALFVMCSVLFGWLPETPYWLLANGREEVARQTLRWLAAVDDDEQSECHLDDWRSLCDAAAATKRQRRQEVSSYVEVVRDASQRRALIIIVAITCIQVLCGSLTTIAYAEQIFANLVSTSTSSASSSASLTAGQVSLIFGAVQLIAATASASAVDALGRRPLLLASVAGTGLCNAVVCVCEVLPGAPAWLPVAAIMLGVVSYFAGLATVIFALLPELLPERQRSCGAAVYALLSAGLIFAVNKLFQVVTDGWGQGVAFGAFAVCGAVFGPLLWWWVPETRGKGLVEIREELRRAAEDGASWGRWRRRRRSGQQEDFC